jgi:integrase
VRVRLKGIVSVGRKLAGGRTVTYWYAWRGGPRIVGEPGSPQFIASFTAAHASRRQPDASKFLALIAGYKQSKDFERLEPRTKHDYLRHLARIEAHFGDMPLAALEDPRVTRDLLEWRDQLAISPRQADYAWQVLMRVLSWARGRGMTLYRSPERIARLYHADRSDRVWLEENLAAFLAKASEPLQRALVLALETGQRQGDLLALAWSAYDGIWIRLRQQKTGARVNIPVTKRLRAVLDNAPRLAITILTDRRGRPWRPSTFRDQWRAASRKAGIDGLTFHDLRGTAVTRLAEAGCTHPEIAAITGHSLRNVADIIDRYLARTDKLAVAAISKLERATKNVD